MKRLLVLPMLATLFCLTLHAISTKAQTKPVKKNGLSISLGIITPDEIRGFGSGELLGPYMSFPSVFTSAIFVTYRRRVTKHFSAGITTGMDNQAGDITYGDEHHGRFGGGLQGVTGRYLRQAYTIAAEARLIYRRDGDYSLAGYIGGGYTFASSSYTFLDNINYKAFYEYSTAPNATNPYTYRRDQFAYQITPLAIRVGRKVAGTFEMGYGYKGMFSGGLSVKL